MKGAKETMGLVIFVILAGTLQAQTPTRDPLEFVVIREISNDDHKYTHDLFHRESIQVDVDNALTVDVNSEIAKNFDGKALILCASAEGPIALTPTAQIVPPKEMRWEKDTGRISGEPLLINPKAIGLKAGDSIRIRLEVRIDSDGHCEASAQKAVTSLDSQSRQVGVLVSMTRLGLTRYEAETFAFVRSAQSSGWDARPGANAMFGYSFRDNHWLNKRLFWNAISPSAGVSVLFLDFDKNQTLEFGVGPSVSFLEGQVNLGWGWNLSTDFQKKQYFFLGISFTKIAGFIERKVGKNP